MKLFKWKNSKPKKEKEPEVNIEKEKKPKKSIFRRFYTTVFLKTEENHIIKQNTTDISNHKLDVLDTEDLILFYLLEINKSKSQSHPHNLSDVNEQNFMTNIMKELNNQNIEIKELSSLCIEGIPKKFNIIRPICWKLLLNYLPSQKSKWKETLTSNQNFYDEYVNLSFSSKNKKNSFSMEFSSETTNKVEKDLLFQKCMSTDHPLSKEKSSNWNTFFTDQKLWDEIEKDTKRTKKNTSFFSEINFNNEFYRYPNLTQNIRDSTCDAESHYTAITRLLFIYAKQHPDLRYVQGMNEIIATLYYCFYNDENIFFKHNCETDTYFCFERIMQEIKENFVIGVDRKLNEMEKRTKQFNELFKKIDLKLWEHLKKNNISSEFYFNKWLISMLTQEFDLNNILNIWDAIISSKNMLDYVIYLCMGLLLCMREQLQTADFSQIMELLQNTSGLDIKTILNFSNTIFKEVETNKK